MKERNLERNFTVKMQLLLSFGFAASFATASCRFLLKTIVGAVSMSCMAALILGMIRTLLMATGFALFSTDLLAFLRAVFVMMGISFCNRK